MKFGDEYIPKILIDGCINSSSLFKDIPHGKKASQRNILIREHSSLSYILNESEPTVKDAIGALPESSRSLY